MWMHIKLPGFFASKLTQHYKKGSPILLKYITTWVRDEELGKQYCGS